MKKQYILMILTVFINCSENNKNNLNTSASQNVKNIEKKASEKVYVKGNNDKLFWVYSFGMPPSRMKTLTDSLISEKKLDFVDHKLIYNLNINDEEYRCEMILIKNHPDHPNKLYEVILNYDYPYKEQLSVISGNYEKDKIQMVTSTNNKIYQVIYQLYTKKYGKPTTKQYGKTFEMTDDIYYTLTKMYTEYYGSYYTVIKKPDYFFKTNETVIVLRQDELGGPSIHYYSRKILDQKENEIKVNNSKKNTETINEI